MTKAQSLDQNIPPQPDRPDVRAALIVIGDEILSGRTQDKNIAYLANWLNDQGIALKAVHVVPDDKEAIGKAVNALKPPAYDYLFTTGGIGPTHDDITVESIAAALGRKVIIHPQAEALLRDFYGADLTDVRLRMARAPEGASLLPNPISAAPGLRVGDIFIMAGVPRITQAMLEGLKGTLRGGRPKHSRAVGAWAGESRAAQLLRDLEARFAPLRIGSYPFMRDGRVGVNFVMRDEDDARLEACAEALKSGLRALGITPHDREL